MNVEVTIRSTFIIPCSVFDIPLSTPLKIFSGLKYYLALPVYRSYR